MGASPQTPGIFTALCIKRTNRIGANRADVNHHSSMQDKSIDGALLALRKQIVRGNLGGLSHVEALLTLRGVHMPAVLPAKKADVAKRGQMARLVKDSLRRGPMTRLEVASIVVAARPELSLIQANQRTAQALYNLAFIGVLVRDGRLWGLAR